MSEVTAFDESACLSVDPFAGDFGGPGDRVLRDKIVIARKAGTCGMCVQPIAVGEKARSFVAIFDDGLCSYRWCAKCCEAMAASPQDGGQAWEKRIALGDGLLRPSP